MLNPVHNQGLRQCLADFKTYSMERLGGCSLYYKRLDSF